MRQRFSVGNLDFRHVVGSPEGFIQVLFVRCSPRHPKVKSACLLGVVDDTLIFAGFCAEPSDNVVRRLGLLAINRFG